jgi:hypothetical protein
MFLNLILSLKPSHQNKCLHCCKLKHQYHVLTHLTTIRYMFQYFSMSIYRYPTSNYCTIHLSNSHLLHLQLHCRYTNRFHVSSIIFKSGSTNPILKSTLVFIPVWVDLNSLARKTNLIL